MIILIKPSYLQVTQYYSYQAPLFYHTDTVIVRLTRQITNRVMQVDELCQHIAGIFFFKQNQNQNQKKKAIVEIRVMHHVHRNFKKLDMRC